MPLCQTVMKALFTKRWKSQDYNNLKLILDKLKLLKNIYEKAKNDLIEIIQEQLHWNQLSLLESKTIT